MKISYKKLWVIHFERGKGKVASPKNFNIAAGTMARLSKVEEAVLSVLLRFCGYLSCGMEDICKAVREGA